MPRWWFIAFVGAICTLSAEVDFQRDVRPILAGHCFKCHGPDEKARKAKLRLDQRPEEEVLRALLKRIDHADSEEVMPPPAAALRPLAFDACTVLQMRLSSAVLAAAR